MTALGPFAALDHVFRIEVIAGSDPELARLLDPLATDRAPSTTYEVGLPADGRPGWVRSPDRRVEQGSLPALRARLVQEIGLDVVAALGDQPVVHGCLVDVDGRGVLVVGRSGAGKSTLVARLLAGGAGLVTEDLTAVAPDGTVRPYPRPLVLSARALPVLGLEPPAEDCGCGCMDHVLHPEDLGGRVTGPVPIDLVVLRSRTAATTEERSLAWMLAALFDEASLANATGPAGLGAVAAVLAGARCAVLGSRDLDDAAAEVHRLLGLPVREAAAVAVEAHDGVTALYADGEAVLHTGDAVHHLDAAATAVWVLHTEGLTPAEVAAELGWDPAAVDATVDRLRRLRPPARTG